MPQTQDPLVSTQWLAEHLSAPDVRIVDATWFMPGVERDARAEYAQGHIPGAVFFDIDEISDLSSPLPHMAPPPEKFSSRVRKMGLGDGNRIVVYDAHGVFSAARVWWTFRLMGHEDVVVLDGGLPKWVAEGRAMEDMPPPPRERHFTARFNADLVRSAAQVKRVLESGKEQLLDARPAARFTGDVPEPRAGLRSGHMPGARNLPASLLTHADGTLLAAPELEAAFEAAGIDLARPVVTTCGSGITASLLALALARLGRWRTPVYDGSWAEWGAENPTGEALPVVTGQA
jgi:thiosulfate/3-mercaptopyruvate sulfurtransferase